MRIQPMLKQSLVCSSPACELGSADLEAITKIIGWESQPFMPKMGRSAWYRLRKPTLALAADRPVTIRSVKIKGVGLRNHHDELSKPSSLLYMRTIAHLGFTDTGDFLEVFGAPSPM